MRTTIWGFCLLIGTASPGLAQSAPAANAPVEQNLRGARMSCTATNVTRDQRCSIACEPGQVAECDDAEVGDVPTCQCQAAEAPTP